MEGYPVRGCIRWHGSLNDRKRGKFARKAEVQWTSLWRAACCPRLYESENCNGTRWRLAGVQFAKFLVLKGRNISPANTLPTRFSLSWGAFWRAETPSASTSSGVAQAVSLYSLTVIPLARTDHWQEGVAVFVVVVESCAITNLLGDRARILNTEPERVFVRTDTRWLTVCCRCWPSNSVPSRSAHSRSRSSLTCGRELCVWCVRVCVYYDGERAFAFREAGLMISFHWTDDVSLSLRVKWVQVV